MPENETKLNEQQKNVADPKKEEGIDTFLKAAEDVRKNTVSKEEYEKVKTENKKLTEFILEGGDETSKTSTKPEVRSKAELQKVLANEETNNLEYTKAALELRQQLIDEGKRDPFLPNSSQIPTTSIDVEGAEKVAKVLQECVDESEGDPETFNFLFGKRVNDSSPLLNAKVRKASK